MVESEYQHTRLWYNQDIKGISVCKSYNTGKSALPDIRTYTHVGRGCTSPKGEYIYVYL